MHTTLVSSIMATNLKIKEISSCARRSRTIPYQYIGGGAKSQRTNPYYIAQHINGHGDLENVSRVFWIPKVHRPHATNGANRHGIHKVCHEIWEVGTLVETILPVKPPNFLTNMIQQIAHTGHTLPPCELRAIFTAQHECTTTQWRCVLHPKTKTKHQLPIKKVRETHQNGGEMGDNS